MKPERHPDWQLRLSIYLTEVARNPFQWGTHDCVQFAASAVKAMTGEDLAALYKGTYSSAAQAARVLKTRGLTIAELPDQHFSKRPVARAMPGDIALVSEAGRDALGIVQGDRIYVLREYGLGLVSLLDARAVWEV